MTTSAQSKKSSLPSLTSDLFDTEKFFSPRIWDFNNDFFDGNGRVPSVNIVENGKDYKIELAAPGREKSDFNVSVDNDMLTISSEKSEETNEEKENYTRREFSYNSFSRSFRLPENCLPEKIEAKYENGLLRLSIPKKEIKPVKTPKEIKVA